MEQSKQSVLILFNFFNNQCISGYIVFPTHSTKKPKAKSQKPKAKSY